MENVTLAVIYDELKKLEKLVYSVDQKIENFMGFEKISKAELVRLKKTSKEMANKSKSLSVIASEMGVNL